MLAGLHRWLPRVVPLIAAAVAMAVIALVPGQAHAQDPSAPEPQAFEPEFSSGACPEHLEVPHDAVLTCGYVTVLEDRAKPDGRVIELYVVRIRDLSPIRYPYPPVIYLAGGPGGSATRATQRFLDQGRSLWAGRYLVLFDQRGIGGSRPRLECPQYRHDYADIRDRDLDPDEELEWRVEALLGCKRTLGESGIDLGTYTSASTAADVADIASAMGFDSFNLYGSSYGTLLALTVMRDFPAGVRSVILDGVLPLQVRFYETYFAEWAAAVDRFFRHCEAAPVCSRRYPDLEENFWGAADRYADAPFTLEYYDRYADRFFDEEFDGDFVAARLATSLRSDRLIPYLTFLVSEIAAGNDFVADAWARPVSWDDSEPIDNTAAWASMWCYSVGPLLDHAKIAADRAAHQRFVDPEHRHTVPALCDRWNDRPTDPVESKAVASDIPTLLLSGQFDPTTPPRWADLAAETLSNSYSFVVPMAGHGVGIDTQCGRKLMESFLYRPDQRPDSSCLMSDQPQFSDIYLNRGPRTTDTQDWGIGSSLRSTLFPVYAVAMASWVIQVVATTSSLTQPVATASWLIQGVAGVPALIVWPLTVLIVWPLTVLTVWPIIFVVSRRRQVPSSTNRLAGPARVIAAAALLIIVGFIFWALSGEDTDDVVRNFGYHPSIRLWFIIPYLIAPIAVLVLYLAYRAWRERWWSLLGRVHYTLVALSIVWSLVYLRAGGSSARSNAAGRGYSTAPRRHTGKSLPRTPIRGRYPVPGPWIPVYTGATGSPHFHPLMWPAQGHGHWYENRGKTPTSVIPAHAGIQSPAAVVNSDWRRRSHFHPLVCRSQPAWVVPVPVKEPAPLPPRRGVLDRNGSCRGGFETRPPRRGEATQETPTVVPGRREPIPGFPTTSIPHKLPPSVLSAYPLR